MKLLINVFHFVFFQDLFTREFLYSPESMTLAESMDFIFKKVTFFLTLSISNIDWKFIPERTFLNYKNNFITV